MVCEEFNSLQDKYNIFLKVLRKVIRFFSNEQPKSENFMYYQFLFLELKKKKICATYRHISLHHHCPICGEKWPYVALCGAFFLINTNRHISPHLVTYRHIWSLFATYGHFSPHIGQWRNVTKCGDTWRKFFYFLIKCGQVAPQFNFVCATIRYIAPQSATLLCGAMWPQNATIRYVVQKLQMNVFRSIYTILNNIFDNLLIKKTILTWQYQFFSIISEKYNLMIA